MSTAHAARTGPCAPALPAVTAALLCLAMTGAGCESMSEFRGSFAGRITVASFVRSCFADDITATLEFDPKYAVGEPRADNPNRLTTDDGAFTDTPLIPVAVLSSDALSELEFSGGDRLRNYLLLARPESGPLAGRDATVVVSLLESHRIELRVIARSADGSAACATEADAGTEDASTEDASAEDASAPRQFFGVFSMKVRR